MATHSERLLDAACALPDENEFKVPPANSNVAPVKIGVRIFVLPPDRDARHRFYFVTMMLAYAMVQKSEGSRLSAILSILNLIFGSDSGLFTLIANRVAAVPTYVKLRWTDPENKIGLTRDYLMLDVKPVDSKDESWVARLRDSAKALSQICPEMNEDAEWNSRMNAFVFRQIVFGFAKSVTNLDRAVEWAAAKIDKLVAGESRTDAPRAARFGKEALDVIVSAFNESLVARQAMIEVLIFCLGAPARDEIVTALSAQAMYLRNQGMTPLMLVKKYAIEAGYPELRAEKGLGSEIKSYITARKLLIEGGARSAFMFYVGGAESTLMNPAKFPKLFSFAIGAGRVEEASLADYQTSFPLNDTWVALGTKAAQNRTAEGE